MLNLALLNYLACIIFKDPFPYLLQLSPDPQRGCLYESFIHYRNGFKLSSSNAKQIERIFLMLRIIISVLNAI